MHYCCASLKTKALVTSLAGVAHHLVVEANCGSGRQRHVPLTWHYRPIYKHLNIFWPQIVTFLGCTPNVYKHAKGSIDEEFQHSPL